MIICKKVIPLESKSRGVEKILRVLHNCEDTLDLAIHANAMDPYHVDVDKTVDYLISEAVKMGAKVGKPTQANFRKYIKGFLGNEDIFERKEKEGETLKSVTKKNEKEMFDSLYSKFIAIGKLTPEESRSKARKLACMVTDSLAKDARIIAGGKIAKIKL